MQVASIWPQLCSFIHLWPTPRTTEMVSILSDCLFFSRFLIQQLYWERTGEKLAGLLETQFRTDPHSCYLLYWLIPSDKGPMGYRILQMKGFFWVLWSRKQKVAFDWWEDKHITHDPTSIQSTKGQELVPLPWVLFNSTPLPPPQWGQRGLSKMQARSCNLHYFLNACQAYLHIRITRRSCLNFILLSSTLHLTKFKLLRWGKEIDINIF